ncbi:hypothetical protein V6N13_144226 [Hibiscus sabdariffa]
MEAKTLEAELLQDWQCPEGTIPIVRSPQNRPRRKTSFFSSSSSIQPGIHLSNNHEYAQVSWLGSNIFGASGRLNVWKPATFNDEFSLTQIWVVAGRDTETNTVEVGWQVYTGTNYTRSFIFWTSDGYQRTGCYNLECPGFVQTSNKLTLGGKIVPISRYGGDQFEISIYIHKDKKSGNWWLRIMEIDVGYWPGSIFNKLSDRADYMKPSSYPRGMEAKTLEAELLHDWQCPEGTIPIVRSPQNRPRRKTSIFSSGIQPGVHLSNNHEYAQVSLLGGNFFGASGRLNVWKPATFNGEFSLTQIWVVAARGTEVINTVEAGWQTLAGRNYTRLFVFWTSDGYQRTGCYNLECPGFVQTSHKLTLGGKIEPVSRYGGDQFEISIYIHKDKKSGNWWLRIQEIDVGYWPGSIFNKLSDRADYVSWGGEIINSGSQGRHTSTQMGSGHFPGEGYRKASYVRNLRYVDESRAIKDADPHNLHYKKFIML